MGLFSKDEPQPVDVLGNPLRCHVCSNDTFWQSTAQLNTAIASFFSLDWANRSAVCMTCSSCGYIHWFISK
jgi:hypothetical protein